MSNEIPSWGSKGPKVKYPTQAIGTYPARLVSFVGLGVQERPSFQGKAKGPAFKAQLAFELVGQTVVGTDETGKQTEPRPSCVFDDVFIFPGMEKGNAYDLCKVFDPSIKAVPKDLGWWLDQVGKPCIVTVGHYLNKAKETRAKVETVGPMIVGMNPPEASSKLVRFSPYDSSDVAKETYNNLAPFQRDILAVALDKANIPFAGVARETSSTEDSSTAQAGDGRTF